MNFVDIAWPEPTFHHKWVLRTTVVLLFDFLQKIGLSAEEMIYLHEIWNP